MERVADMQFYGIDAIVRIISHLMFICVTFWALQAVRIDQFFKNYYVEQIRIVFIFLSIVVGYNVSSFFLEFLTLSRNIFLSLLA